MCTLNIIFKLEKKLIINLLTKAKLQIANMNSKATLKLQKTALPFKSVKEKIL